MNTLHRSDELKEIYPTPPLVAYRRDKHLQEITNYHKVVYAVVFNEEMFCYIIMFSCPNHRKVQQHTLIKRITRLFHILRFTTYFESSIGRINI
jgi:hypothetical protein